MAILSRHKSRIEEKLETTRINSKTKGSMNTEVVFACFANVTPTGSYSRLRLFVCLSPAPSSHVVMGSRKASGFCHWLLDCGNCKTLFTVSLDCGNCKTIDRVHLTDTLFHDVLSLVLKPR